MDLQPWIVIEQKYARCIQPACRELLRNSWEQRKSSEWGNGHGTTNAGSHHRTVMTPPRQTFIRTVNYVCTRHFECSAPACSLTYVRGIKHPSRSFYGSPRMCKAVCNMLIFRARSLWLLLQLPNHLLLAVRDCFTTHLQLPALSAAIRSIIFCLIFCCMKM